MNQSSVKESIDDEDSKSNEINQKNINLDINNDNDIKQPNEDHFEIDHRGLQMYKPRTQFTSIPIKTLVLSIFLLITGISFIIAGIVSLVNHDENSKTISFLAFGSVLAIPGIYYTIQLCQAYIAETPEERQEILDDIPV